MKYRFKISIPNRIVIILFVFIALIRPIQLSGQEESEKAFFIKKLHEIALSKQMSYKWLSFLSEKIGGRIAGSPQSLAAVEFTHQVLDSLNTTRVWNQACQVNYWYRGEKEQGKIVNNSIIGNKDLQVVALGGSSATGQDGLTAEVIEVKSLDEAKALGARAKGKILFFSRAFNNGNVRTFNSYGESVDQRVFGPNTAAKLGAKACLVRSMTGKLDDIPHTGVTIFEENVKPIPSLAVSTNGAELLSSLIRQSKVELFLKTMCEDRGPKTSYSVIGEIKGSEKPNEIILVGGHLDSWDIGGGAHDDGAGCVHSMEVFYLLKQMNYKPKRTLRCVLFMNEENGLAGGKTYAEESTKAGEYHYAAIESDAGGFSPRGFGYDIDTTSLSKFSGFFAEWSGLLATYDLSIKKGGTGADIGPLRPQKGILFGLSPDSQRYFDFHHTEADRIEAVHPRELALGSAAMASLVYLLDQTP
ncbi:MAG: M28 family peptidase [Saprospiraceae bacterium]